MLSFHLTKRRVESLMQAFALVFPPLYSYAFPITSICFCSLCRLVYVGRLGCFCCLYLFGFMGSVGIFFDYILFSTIILLLPSRF